MGAESHDHESGAQYPLEAQKTFGKGRSRKVRNTGQLTEKESQEFGAAHLDTNSVPSTSANSPDISTLIQDPPLYNKNPPPPPTNQEDPSSSESIDVDADQDQAMANFLVIP